MRLGVLLSLQLLHMILKIHTFCAVLGCQSGQKRDGEWLRCVLLLFC